MNENKTFIPKSFAVIGAGPTGCVLAAFLAKGGYEVIFCDLVKDFIEPSLNRGILIDGIEQFKQPVKHICGRIEELDDFDVDVIFVATKATASNSVASSIDSIRNKKTYVVSWQNGIDTEMEFKKIGEDRVIRAVVNYGCALVGPAHVHMSFHHYPHYLQEMSLLSKSSAKVIAEVMTSCGLVTSHTVDIKSMVWRKAILNACMNPVCAVTGLTMHEAMSEEYIFDIVASLVKECISVARANEIQIEEGYYEQAINYMRKAGNHKPSMLMDIESNRITEIDYINGKFEEYGILKGIKTPYNSIFKALVKGKEFKF